MDFLDLPIENADFPYSYVSLPEGTSGGTKFMLLESFTKHPSRSTADHMFKSVLCGRCGTVNDQPF